MRLWLNLQGLLMGVLGASLLVNKVVARRIYGVEWLRAISFTSLITRAGSLSRRLSLGRGASRPPLAAHGVLDDFRDSNGFDIGGFAGLGFVNGVLSGS
jgi:hypothetical protein